MALRVAATLRVADAIAAGVTSGPDLADRLAVAVDPLVRVLDHLVTAGFLRRDEDGSYALTDAGQWLREDHPQGIRAWIDLEGAVGYADTSVVELLHTVRTGEPAFPRRFGRGFWEDLAEHPDRAASFDALMGSGLSADAPAIAAAYDWSALGDVIDVGGGDGSLLIALLHAHRTLRGTVLDLASPAATAARALAAAGLADRGCAQSGSFFEPLPRGAGGYILSRVIHDWDDDDARRILRNCAHAARPNGKILVIQDSEPGESASTEMDLRMLAYFLGRDRSLERLTELAHEAGLALGTVAPATRLRSIIELLPD
jgi:2,7-dihydroxy-5-methyl-1-naphthoate 7-O-methyltransferase